MNIKITAKNKPFTHSFGKSLILPGSDFCLRVYPQMVFVDNLYNSQMNVLSLKNNLTAPVKGFTVQQNIEKGFVDIWGNTPVGYFGYRVQALKSSQGITLNLLSKAQKPLIWEIVGDGVHTKDHNIEYFTFNRSFDAQLEQHRDREVLHLGNHKQQDWELIQRRCDMTEILPLWYAVGQMTAGHPIDQKPSLFNLCAEAIEGRHNDQIVPCLINLFKAGFTGMFCPQLIDTNYQGFELNPVESKTALALLSEGSRLIRSLFVRQSGMNVELLPALPPQFHCGRMKNVKLEGIGTLDVEWTKKMIRRLIIRPSHAAEVKLQLQSKVHSYRIRTGEALHGVNKDNGDTLTLKAGYTYLLDRFQK